MEKSPTFWLWTKSTNLNYTTIPIGGLSGYNEIDRVRPLSSLQAEVEGFCEVTPVAPSLEGGTMYRNAKISSPEIGIERQRCRPQRPEHDLPATFCAYRSLFLSSTLSAPERPPPATQIPPLTPPRWMDRGRTSTVTSSLEQVAVGKRGAYGRSNRSRACWSQGNMERKC